MNREAEAGGKREKETEAGAKNLPLLLLLLLDFVYREPWCCRECNNAKQLRKV